MALRVCGLFRERILMVPVCGAGMLVVWMTEVGVEYLRRLPLCSNWRCKARRRIWAGCEVGGMLWRSLDFWDEVDMTLGKRNAGGIEPQIGIARR